MERFRKLFAEVETDEHADFDTEDNGREDVFEEIFSNHECFCEHDKDSEEDGDSRNEEVNNLELFSSKEGIEWRKTKFRQNICCHDIVSSLPGTKGTVTNVTSPVKSWELFLKDNMIHLIVESAIIYIEKWCTTLFM
ncbi:hypothetical protein AVEN_208154-1 [Araneus ventricosus]|uniref:PiggyBac transposable element-derived protein domain-containing protein n=1 Tax=Araneus ventricosus TaxID=182803 RepID=A0A4Y2L7Q1_ARAVE|nr:hypothetical protein AVEN_208154-1 [Araneus ventricosus]